MLKFKTINFCLIKMVIALNPVEITTLNKVEIIFFIFQNEYVRYFENVLTLHYKKYGFDFR